MALKPELFGQSDLKVTLKTPSCLVPRLLITEAEAHVLEAVTPILERKAGRPQSCEICKPSISLPRARLPSDLFCKSLFYEAVPAGPLARLACYFFLNSSHL
jgi:hypothetical protein